MTLDELSYDFYINKKFCNKKNKDKIRMDLNSLILAMSWFRHYHKLVCELDKEVQNMEVYNILSSAKYPTYNPEFDRVDYLITAGEDYVYITYEMLKETTLILKKYYNKLKKKGDTNAKKI